MRTDESLPDKTFRHSKRWRIDPDTGAVADAIDERYVRGGIDEGHRVLRHSFSGHERNHLFMNQQGTTFEDISGISGVDNVADSRSFVIWDYDRDGWNDIALTNANQPLLNWYHNQLADAHGSGDRRNNFIAIRFQGGNRLAKPSTEYSNRDGYGAVVRLRLPTGQTLRRDHRCGEGFAAQNSATLLVGIGSSRIVERVSVWWPSGKTTEAEKVPAGTLLTCFENPAESENEIGFHREPYVRGVPDRMLAANGAQKSAPEALDVVDSDTLEQLDEHGLVLVTTMATWCDACKREIPQLTRLREQFSRRQLAVVGFPIDPIDTPEGLQKYLAEFQPSYQLLRDVTPGQREQVRRAVQRMLPADVLPASLILDRRGNVLAGLQGIPNVSALNRVLEKANSR